MGENLKYLFIANENVLHSGWKILKKISQFYPQCIVWEQKHWNSTICFYHLINVMHSGWKSWKKLIILPKVHKLKMENLCTVGENLQKISWFCFNYWDKISSRNYSFTHCAIVSVKIKTTYFYYFEMYLCRTFYKESTIIDRNVQKEC